MLFGSDVYTKSEILFEQLDLWIFRKFNDRSIARNCESLVARCVPDSDSWSLSGYPLNRLLRFNLRTSWDNIDER